MTSNTVNNARPETPNTMGSANSGVDLSTPTRHQRDPSAAPDKYAEPYRRSSLSTREQLDDEQTGEVPSIWQPSLSTTLFQRRRDDIQSAQHNVVYPRSSTPAPTAVVRHEVKTWPPPPLVPDQEGGPCSSQEGTSLSGKSAPRISDSSTRAEDFVIPSSPRATEVKAKLLSSPGGQRGVTSSFFEDMTSYRANQHTMDQPLSAYPKPIGTQKGSSGVGDNGWPPPTASLSSPSSDASSFQSAMSETSQLRTQLIVQQVENARLAKRCQELTDENQRLTETLQRIEAEYSSSMSSSSLTPWNQSSMHRVLSTDKLHHPIMSAHGPDASPHVQRVKHSGYFDESSPASLNADHAGDELLQQIRYQAQAGYEGGRQALGTHELTPPSHQYSHAQSHWPASPTQQLLHARQQQNYLQRARASYHGDQSLPLDLTSYPLMRAGYDQRALPPHAPRARSHSPSTPYMNASGLPAQNHHHHSAPPSPASLMPEVLVAKALTGRSQEASIALQQQLKSGQVDLQQSILRALEAHLLQLCEDKHGNFLIQRAIAVDASIAWKLKGNFAHLTTSQYGCHVVQRILDTSEDLQRQIVDELLSNDMFSNFTSRNCVHVWAKILEIKWSDAAFGHRVFESINGSMRGRWHQLATQETGSIIVQNLFESAREEDKAECIQEVLDRLPDCAANQWGVWVVQHLIEHGSPENRQKAYDRLVEEAPRLSLSQYGHKAIMTALKGKDPHFLKGYINKLVEGQEEGGIAQQQRSGNGHVPSHSMGEKNRRSMLVEVASVPQGLQIVTQLLTTVGREERERIIKAVRKNSVFLKGNKTGLKVHQMCERARAYSGY